MDTAERIDPKKTVLLVIDMENDFVAPGAPFEVPAGRAMLPTLTRVLACCRERGIRVIYTTHAHRRDGSDMGLLARNPQIARGEALADGEHGVAIYPAIAPQDHEIVIKKHRYSAFCGTDLDMVLRGLGVRTVVITGVTTENCCHATARDAFFHNYEVVVLSDATATDDYPDLGQGAMSAAEVHRASLVILAGSTADVMTADMFMSSIATTEPDPALEG